MHLITKLPCKLRCCSTLIKLLSILVERWGRFQRKTLRNWSLCCELFGIRPFWLEISSGIRRFCVPNGNSGLGTWNLRLNTLRQKRIPSFNTGDPTEFQQCSRRKLLLLFGTMAARTDQHFWGLALQVCCIFKWSSWQQVSSCFFSSGYFSSLGQHARTWNTEDIFIPGS